MFTMVTIDREFVERQAEDARVSLREEPPESLRWVNYLTPLHQRLFALEMSSAVSDYLMLKDTESAVRLVELLESWEATAELDANPDVAARIKASRETKEYVDWSAPS